MSDIVISENATLEEFKELFGRDRYAALTGCELLAAGKGYGLAELQLNDNHLNAAGNIMGGAIMTLADFVLGVACNVGQPPTVGAQNSVQFISAPKLGCKLIAECKAKKMGRKMGFYTCEVREESGKIIAVMEGTCCRV